jgi:hypothetical protein
MACSSVLPSCSLCMLSVEVDVSSSTCCCCCYCSRYCCCCCCYQHTRLFLAVAVVPRCQESSALRCHSSTAAALLQASVAAAPPRHVDFARLTELLIAAAAVTAIGAVADSALRHTRGVALSATLTVLCCYMYGQQAAVTELPDTAAATAAVHQALKLSCCQ